MYYRNTTQVPNEVFDRLMSELTGGELKVLLVIIRQTFGWRDRYTGLRKEVDRITHSQFIKKTGLSRRAISRALDILKQRNLINISCHNGNFLNDNKERQGKYILKYSLNLCQIVPELVPNSTNTCAKMAHNKTNYTKLNHKTKEPELPLRQNRVRSIGEILKGTGYKVLIPD